MVQWQPAPGGAPDPGHDNRASSGTDVRGSPLSPASGDWPMPVMIDCRSAANQGSSTLGSASPGSTGQLPADYDTEPERGGSTQPSAQAVAALVRAPTRCGGAGIRFAGARERPSLKWPNFGGCCAQRASGR